MLFLILFVELRIRIEMIQNVVDGIQVDPGTLNASAIKVLRTFPKGAAAVSTLYKLYQ